MGKLISLSTMREVQIPECVVGQMVKYTGDMANHSGIGAVIAIRPVTQFCSYQSYDVALDDGREFLGTMLDSSRWVILDEVAIGDTLDILRAGVGAKKATDNAAKSAAKEAFAQAVAKLRTEYPHLTQCSSTVSARKAAAANIRTELKRAFPAVKFSVRSDNDSIRICWTDGPTSEQVEKITNKYEAGSFDGMTDCYNYSRSPWTEVFGDAKYIFCNRDYSDKMLSSVIRRVCSHLGGMDSIPAPEDYRMGRLYQFKQSGGCDVDREIRSALSRHTYCITKAA